MLLDAISYEPLLQIHLGPFSVSPHGIMTAVGLLVGVRIVLPAIRRAAIDTDKFLDVLTKAVLGAVVGARLAYVVNHLGNYTDDPLAVFKLWEGGLSLLGGLAGAVVVGAPLARRAGLPVVRLLDLVVPGVAAGIAVGRIGDLIIADHLGKPTEFVLGYVCPAVDTGSPCLAGVGQAVHQTALYDLLAAAAIAVALLSLRRRPHPQGFLAVTFGAVYGAARFVEGFSRVDVTHGTGLNGSQWTAVGVGVACLIGLVVLARRRDRVQKVPLDSEPAPGSSPTAGRSS